MLQKTTFVKIEGIIVAKISKLTKRIWTNFLVKLETIRLNTKTSLTWENNIIKLNQLLRLDFSDHFLVSKRIMETPSGSGYYGLKFIVLIEIKYDRLHCYLFVVAPFCVAYIDDKFNVCAHL